MMHMQQQLQIQQGNVPCNQNKLHVEWGHVQVCSNCQHHWSFSGMVLQAPVPAPEVFMPAGMSEAYILHHLTMKRNLFDATVQCDFHHDFNASASEGLGESLPATDANANGGHIADSGHHW